MRDLIIIWGSAAWCCAGIYAARKKIDTLLISKDFIWQIGKATNIKNYLWFPSISWLDLIKKFKEHLIKYDIEIKSFEEILNINKIDWWFEVITDENKYKSKTIIIASWWTNKKLNIKNEDKFIGKWISYCVTCDEASFDWKTVVIIGAGNSWLQAAIELTHFAKKVYILECSSSCNADKILVEEVNRNSKIKIIFWINIKSFEGDKFLTKIIFEDKKINKIKELLVDWCFIEVWYIPNTKFCSKIIKLNKLNEIIVNPKTMMTSCKWIFACWDITNFKDKQIILAAWQWALASLSVFRYLNKCKTI